jgi:hypothetical protein
MITFLLYTAIVVLEAYIIFCEYRIWMYFKRRSDAKTDSRRALFRDRAYKIKSKEAIIAENRKKLWRFIK